MTASAADRSEGVQSLILHDDEVRALRDAGEVTVVRRIREPDSWNTWHLTTCGIPGEATWQTWDASRDEPVRCPLGMPSERRWVKECWATVEPMVAYRADGIGPHNDLTWQVERWRSAVHMPQWASRLTAECASVTVQQREGVWEWHAVYRRVAACKARGEEADDA